MNAICAADNIVKNIAQKNKNKKGGEKKERKKTTKERKKRLVGSSSYYLHVFQVLLCSTCFVPV